MSVLTVLASLAGWVGLSLVKPAGVALAQTQLPHQALSDKPLYMMLSRSSLSGVIDAPDDYAKIYFDEGTTSPSIQIFNPNFDPCGNKAAGYDYTSPFTGNCSYPPADPNYEIDYDFYNTDIQENPTSLILSLDGQNGTDANTGAPVIPQPARASWSAPVPLAVSSPISHKTGTKVVYVHVHFKYPLPSGTSVESHAYRFGVTNVLDQLGFVDDTFPLGTKPPSGQYILDTVTPATGDYEVNYEMDFAPSCNVTSDQNEALRWGDADDTSSTPTGGTDGSSWSGDTNPSFTFYQIPPSGSTISTTIFHWKNGQHSTPDVGGNNDYHELPFTAHPGWKYRWVWNNVDSATSNFNNPPNNILMWLPNDSINYEISCWNYHNQIAPDAGYPNGSTIDLGTTSQVTLPLTASNILGQTGPAGATLDPIASVNGGGSAGVLRQAGSWSNPLPAIPGDSTISGGQVTFDLDPGVLQTGDQVCFTSSITPHSETHPGPLKNDPPDVCYTIKNDRRYPSVVGTGSDVHAGGGICNGPQNTDGIDTNPLAGSLGAYVVSGSGMISGIGSNNGAADASLRLGPNGSYATVCRPDLFDYAQHHMPAGASWFVPPPGATYDLANPLPGQVTMTGPSGQLLTVAFFDGDIAIHGQLDHALTIVERTGTVNIDDNITRTGGSNRYSTPVLGIIAHQNVIVQCGCGSDHNIDALIFSDQTIDTCYTAPPGFPWFVPHCDNKLTIHGFLMAQDILLHRLGDTGTVGAQPGEVVIMDPTLYLNPPFYFDDSADSTELNGQSERPPLF